MKKLLLSLFLVGTVSLSFAQMATPVSWAFTSKKISDKIYELHLTATIEPGWHLYAQNQPKDAIAQPTSFEFNAHPLIKYDGKVKENGKMEKFKDEKLGVAANQYSNKVEFIQVVKLKAAARTNVSGKLEYQTCDDKKCLPPKTVNFTIPLQ